MFRSNWTILRERMLSLAKATILWNWMELAQDRDRWRALVNTVKNLWHAVHTSQPEILVATTPHII